MEDREEDIENRKGRRTRKRTERTAQGGGQREDIEDKTGRMTGRRTG